MHARVLGIAALCWIGAVSCSQASSPSAPQSEADGSSSSAPQFSEYRGLQIEQQRTEIISQEKMHEACAPWKEVCVWVEPVNAEVATRGQAPFQAQITPPDNYSTEELGEVSASDWQERHFCGGSLIAPGWVIFATNEVRNSANLTDRTWRIFHVDGCTKNAIVQQLPIFDVHMFLLCNSLKPQKTTTTEKPTTNLQFVRGMFDLDTHSS